MQINKFIDRCVDEGYEWAEGEHKNAKGYFIHSKRFETTTHFSNEAIEKHDWPKLYRSIVQGKDVYQMTRVVGYFSRVRNWNKSKLGELRDRQAGNYVIKK